MITDIKRTSGLRTTQETFISLLLTTDLPSQFVLELFVSPYLTQAFLWLSPQAITLSSPLCEFTFLNYFSLLSFVCHLI